MAQVYCPLVIWFRVECVEAYLLRMWLQVLRDVAQEQRVRDVVQSSVAAVRVWLG